MYVKSIVNINNVCEIHRETYLMLMKREWLNSQKLHFLVQGGKLNPFEDFFRYLLIKECIY